ncbi:helix-turn-helix domain-containing protein [Streptomyces sp. NBC_00986]|uniref:helix-turn-helix domain-containing protein n=1 Tax=Streptomyces sp. NBC_00986 TaxID=2903702 RepID=UPI0038692827|nr:helix-turn-helix domain-containing protein [Streptomyces sp. NBC_00986]
MPTRRRIKQNPPKGCLWIEQAAEYLGLELNTLRKWRLTGKDKADGMPSFKPSGYVAYKTADLDAYLEAQYQAARNPSPTPEMRPPGPRLSRRQGHQGRHGAV